MAKKAQATKRVFYKRAEFLNGGGKPELQTIMSAALNQLRKVGQRKQALGEDGTNVRAIISYRSRENMLFGTIASYEKDAATLTVAEDDDATSLTVQQVAAGLTEDKKRRQFLEGICHFALYKNHIVVLHSVALGSRPFEDHLNWLMHHSKALEEGNRAGFADTISRPTKEKLKNRHVKSVNVGAPLIPSNAVQVEEKHGERTKVALVDVGGRAIETIKAFFGDQLPKSVNLADAINGNIEVSLQLKYRYKTTDKAQKLLDTIALAGRHIDGEDIQVELHGGGRLTGDDLKLSVPLRVDTYDGIVDPDDLFPKMAAWLREQLETSIIEP
ncbi:hypothetical protein ACQVRX_11165 [Ralstonia pseudosolanacearum]